PGMVENWRAGGGAAAEAMVPGLAPGRPALTWRGGKSTLGRSLTGNGGWARRPKMSRPAMSSVVMTGRLMKRSVFIVKRPRAGRERGPTPSHLLWIPARVGADHR